MTGELCHTAIHAGEEVGDSAAETAERQSAASGGISVLSFGFTRGLWEGEGAEDYQRMMGYAAHLDAYVIVANTYKSHGLTPRRLAPHVEAIPTNAFCFADSFLRMLRIGLAALRERRVSLIQAQDPCYTGLAAVILGKLFKLPVNVCVYGPNVFDRHWLASHWSNRLLGPVGRWVLRRCEGVQVDGQMTARSLVAAGLPREGVAVKPVIPANLERFFAIERRAKKAGETLRLLFVGRLCSQKNLPLLLEVVKALRPGNGSCAADRRTAFEVIIVGEGPREAEIRATVRREGLESCIHFRGVVSRDRIADVFAEADIFLLTSDYEGYPRVLMEAAAAALPVVTTAVSGADEAVADGESGFIVPVRSPGAFAEKLALLLENPELRVRMGQAGREQIRALDPRTNTPAQVSIWKRVARPTPAAPAAIRRLLLFNLATDAKHPILGFTTAWIRELAARVESVHVITMYAGEIAVPDNVTVHSVGRERGWSEPRRLVEFYRHLFRVLREEKIDGCFSHMIQVFSALAGPVLRAKGIPLVTWYAHPQLNRTLKLAHFASDRMVTSLPHAYPYRHDKLTVIGQGIDTALFAPAAHKRADEQLILCVGRVSRVKNHPTLLRAFARLPERFRLVILGATAGLDDEKYSAELGALANELGIAGRVEFAGPVPPAELPAHYNRCAVHVNLTPPGFGDKVAWEAMSCGRPCLVANDDFRETLGEQVDALLFRGEDDLATKLRALLTASPAEREKIGLYLRLQVERLHSLPRLAERILVVLGQCRSQRA